MRKVLALVVMTSCARSVHTHTGTNAPDVWTKAHALLSARVARTPRDWDARRELGWLAWIAGDRERARAELEEVSKAKPDDVWAALGVAMISDIEGKDVEAQDGYVKLVARARGGEVGSLGVGEYALAELTRFAEDGYEETIPKQLKELANAPGVLIAEILRRLAVWTDMSADREASSRLATERGCVTTWQAEVVRTPAPRVALMRGDVFAAGQGQAVSTHGCRVTLRAPGGKPTRWVLAATAKSEVDRAVEVELAIDRFDVLARLSIDGEAILARDTARRFYPERVTSHVRLERGMHAILVELASGGEEVGVEVIIRAPETGRREPGVTVTPGCDRDHRGAHVLVDGTRGSVGDGSAVEGALSKLLMARTLLERGDTDAAGELLEELSELTPRFVPVLALRAELALKRPGVSYTIAREDARKQLTRVLAIDPGAVRARIRLAEMQLADGQPKQALETVRPLAGNFRADYVRARAKEDDASMNALLAYAPRTCPILKLELERARRRGRFGEARPLAERITKCDGGTNLLADVAREMGLHDVEIAERLRLLERGLGDPTRWIAAAEAFLARGDRDAARARFEGALVVDPEVTGARLGLAGILAASGAVEAAASLLRARWGKDLAWARKALLGEDPIERWRIDGVEVIRSYEAEERAHAHARYDGSAVLVLDRTVMVFLEDGSRLTLTHNIVRVLKKEGLERWGEINLAEGAEPLIARTVKPDGSTREPELLGKAGLTAPDLAVGDYVELEYLTSEPASETFVGGFVGERFYFGTFDAPLHRTELIVVAPRDWPISWDIRGDAPKPTVVDGEGGTRITTFADRNKEELVAEAQGPPYVEYIASASPYMDVNLGAWRDRLAEETHQARRADFALRRFAEKLVRGARNEREKLARVYDFVQGEIEAVGRLDMEPTRVLARRRGSRAILMIALLEAAGIRAELWLARPRTGGEGVPTGPEISGLSYPLVHVPSEGVVLDLAFAQAPLGFLVPALRGAPALVISELAGGGPMVRIVPGSTNVDTRQVRFDVELAGDGSAEVKVTETMTGYPGVLWREHVTRADKEAISRELEERTLGYYFPGSSLTGLDIDGLPDRGAPLVMRYSFSAPRFARVDQGGRLEIPLAPLPALLGRRYVVSPVRTTELVLDDVARKLRVSMKVRLKSGVRWEGEIPPAITLDAPGKTGRFEVRIGRTASGMEMQSELVLEQLARLKATDYPELVRYAARVDAAEARKALARSSFGRAVAE